MSLHRDERGVYTVELLGILPQGTQRKAEMRESVRILLFFFFDSTVQPKTT